MDMDKKNYTKLFDGSYTYFQNNRPYSEELFKVYKHIVEPNILFQSEIITRLPTGELLKILCYYEVDAKWQPLIVSIKKSVGIRSVTETFESDHLRNKLTYTFKNNSHQKKVEKDMLGSYQISTPSFATALMSAQYKNVTSLGRSRYSMIVSENDWDLIGTFKEKTIYLQAASTDKTTINLNDNNLEAKKILLYEFDAHENVNEEAVTFFASRHMNIPYLIQIGKNTKIQINFFKKTSHDYDDNGLPITRD